MKPFASLLLSLSLLFAAQLEAQTAAFPGAIVTDANLKVAKNRISQKLLAAASPSDNTLILHSSTGIVANSLVSIDNEVIAVCAVVGNQVSVGVASCPNVDGRGFDGTSAASHAAESNVGMYITAWHHNAVAAELKAIENALGVNLGNIGSGLIGTYIPSFTAGRVAFGNGTQLVQDAGFTWDNSLKQLTVTNSGGSSYNSAQGATNALNAAPASAATPSDGQYIALQARTGGGVVQTHTLKANSAGGFVFAPNSTAKLELGGATAGVHAYDGSNASGVGMLLGTLTTGNDQYSQALQFNGRSSGGTNYKPYLQGTSGGGLNVKLEGTDGLNLYNTGSTRIANFTNGGNFGLGLGASDPSWRVHIETPLPASYNIASTSYHAGMALNMNSAGWNSGFNFSLGLIENFRSQVIIPSTANPPRNCQAYDVSLNCISYGPYHSADFASGMSSHVVSQSGSVSAVGSVSRAWIQVSDASSPGVGAGTLATTMNLSTTPITVTVASTPAALQFQGELGNLSYSFPIRIDDEWIYVSSRTCSTSCALGADTEAFTISQRGLFGTAPANHAIGATVVIDTGHYAFGSNPLAIGGTVITGGKEMAMPSRVIGQEINVQGAGPLLDINGLFINSVSHEQAVEGSKGIFLARLGYWRTQTASISGGGLFDISAGGYPQKVKPGDQLLLSSCSIPANNSDTGDFAAAASSVNAAADTITLAAPYFADGNPVRLTSTGTLPAGLSLATTYYVRDVVTGAAPFTIKLAATLGGAAINITDAGTGTHTITDWDTAPVYTVATVTDGYHYTVTPALAFAGGTCNVTKMNDNTYNLPWNHGLWIEDGAGEVGMRLGTRTQFGTPYTDLRSATASQKFQFVTYDGAGSTRNTDLYASNVGYLWTKPGLQSGSLPTWSVIENNNNSTGSVGYGFSLIHSSEATEVFKGGVYMARTGTYGRGDVCIAVDNTADTSNVDPATDRKVCVTAAGKFYFFGLQDGSAGLSSGGLYYDSADSNRLKYVP